MSHDPEKAPFSTLLASVGEARTFSLIMPPEWGQGRSSFGGALTAVGLEAMTRLVDAEARRDDERRRCRSLMVAFVGPGAGELEVTAEVLRSGRSATHTRATLSGEGGVCCTLAATFAQDRPSKLNIAGHERPQLSGLDSAVSLPFIPGITPNFTRYFELRWASGGPPGSGLDARGFEGWVRFREHQRGPSATWIAAMVDAWPAPALQQLKQFAFASSATWSVDFVDEDPEAASDDWWSFAVESERAEGGWAHTRGRLWSPSGRLVATSTQTVAVFG